jgi:hypothetical protein
LWGAVLNFYGDHDKLFSKKREASEGARGVAECADTSGAIRMRILMRNAAEYAAKNCVRQQNSR